VLIIQDFTVERSFRSKPVSGNNGYMGVGVSLESFATIRVTFVGDDVGLFEFQSANAVGESVAIVPDPTGYARQCQEYERKILELESRLSAAKRELESLKSIRVEPTKQIRAGDIVSTGDLPVGAFLRTPSGGDLILLSGSISVPAGGANYSSEGPLKASSEGVALSSGSRDYRINVRLEDGRYVGAIVKEARIEEGTPVYVEMSGSGEFWVTRAGTGVFPPKQEPLRPKLQEPSRFTVLELEGED
jgi:hypothetical protein